MEIDDDSPLLHDFWEFAADGTYRSSELIRQMLDAYTRSLASPARMSALDMELVKMFELRVFARLLLYETGIPPSCDDRVYFARRTAMRLLRLLPIRFRNHVKSLSETEGLALPAHLDPIRAKIAELDDGVERHAPAPYTSPAHKRRQGRDDAKTLRNSAAHPDFESRELRLLYGSGSSDQLNSIVICGHLILTYIDGLVHEFPEKFLGALCKLDAGSSFSMPKDYVRPQTYLSGVEISSSQRIGFSSVTPLLDDCMSALINLNQELYTLTTRLEEYSDFSYTEAGASPACRHRYVSLLFWVRRLALALSIFLELHKALDEHSANAAETHPKIGELLAVERKIKRMRLLVAHGDYHQARGHFAELLPSIDVWDLFYIAVFLSRWSQVVLDGYKRARPGEMNPKIGGLLNETAETDKEKIFAAVELARGRSRELELAGKDAPRG